MNYLLEIEEAHKNLMADLSPLKKVKKKHKLSSRSSAKVHTIAMGSMNITMQPGPTKSLRMTFVTGLVEISIINLIFWQVPSREV